MRDSPNIWIIGAGVMSADYLKILSALGARTQIIGRGKETAQKLEETTGHPVFAGGLDAILATQPPLPDRAIIAVGIEALASVTQKLFAAGVKKILLEKPGALHFSELLELQSKAQQMGAEVLIGYNRRMYASVFAAKKIIEDDGGVQSMQFEFTEWSHSIVGITKAPGVKERWLLANSSHVIDLAFHLGGCPIELTATTAGNLTWHPDSAIFVGSGRTDRNVLFSYHANWGAPGRWSAEFMTNKHRLIFRPMETLQIVKHGSVALEAVEIDYSVDREYKPGLFRQVESFVNDQFSELCSLEEQVKHWPIYEKIAGYKPN